MKFYRSKTKGEYQASPCQVRVDGLNLSFLDDEAFPIIVCSDRVVFGTRGTEHHDMYPRINRSRIENEGRFWLGANVLTLWNFDYSGECNYVDCVKRIIVALRKRIGINPNDVTVYLECAVAQTEEHEYEDFVVAVPALEYIGLNISGDLSEFFWHIMHKEDIAKPQVQQVTSNGMNAKDVWRHYEVAESMRIDENTLRQIVEGVVKEYHQNQQLILPFDGSDEPYNYMQFLEWLDEHSTKGTLPAEPGTMEKIVENDTTMFDVGVSTFYYGTGEEFDAEGYDDFLREFVRVNGQQMLAQGQSVDSIMETIPNVEETKNYLSPTGVDVWSRAMIERGRDTMYWWMSERLEVNESGLIYCERAIDLETLFGRYHDEDHNKDYYEMLEDSYSGIGEYWSYAHGGGCVYFYSAKNPTTVIIRGWVSPRSVNWSATICLDSMDEQELRLDYDATIQIDEIEAWTEDYGKINILGNRGSILMQVQ